MFILVFMPLALMQNKILRIGISSLCPVKGMHHFFFQQRKQVWFLVFNKKENKIKEKESLFWLNMNNNLKRVGLASKKKSTFWYQWLSKEENSKGCRLGSCGLSVKRQWLHTFAGGAHDYHRYNNRLHLLVICS